MASAAKVEGRSACFGGGVLRPHHGGEDGAPVVFQHVEPRGDIGGVVGVDGIERAAVAVENVGASVTNKLLGGLDASMRSKAGGGMIEVGAEVE